MRRSYWEARVADKSRRQREFMMENDTIQAWAHKIRAQGWINEQKAPRVVEATSAVSNDRFVVRFEARYNDTRQIMAA